MKRIVYGEVLAPDVVDAQGDVVRAAEIEAAAHRFLAHGGTVGAMHTDFERGAWVLGVALSEEAWRQVEDGVLTGFSIGGRAIRDPIERRDACETN